MQERIGNEQKKRPYVEQSNVLKIVAENRIECFSGISMPMYGCLQLNPMTKKEEDSLKLKDQSLL